jgi:hypothetical protein
MSDEQERSGAAWAKRLLGKGRKTTAAPARELGEVEVDEPDESRTKTAFENGNAWAALILGKDTLKPGEQLYDYPARSNKTKPQPTRSKPAKTASKRATKPATKPKVRADGGIEVRPGTVRYSGKALANLLAKANPKNKQASRGIFHRGI